MSSLAQAVYDDFRKGRPNSGSCPVVLSDKQERSVTGSKANTWYTVGNSGKDLYKLKRDNPELFVAQERRADVSASIAPPGFESTDQAGWYYNRERAAFFQESSRKFFWWDEAAQERKELCEGQTSDVACLAGAASSASTAASSSSSKPGSKGQAGTSPGAHVVIGDLHRAAAASKIDLGHFDRPAAMLAVFGVGATSSPDEPVTTVARGFHEKLLRRLGGNRSAWSDAALGEALAESVGEARTTAAALVLGRRVVTVASDGAAAFFTSPSFEPCVQSETAASSAAGAASRLRIRSHTLIDTDTESPHGGAYIALYAGDTGLDDGATRDAVQSHLQNGRARAATVALLRAARASGAEGPLVAACARLSPKEIDVIEPPPAKRGKTSVGSQSEKVRVKQVLIRHVGAKGQQDPVRRRKVTRSLEDAEALALETVTRLGRAAPGSSEFTKVCKEVSECTSALKGGEMAGDLGWLDRQKGAAEPQDKLKQAVKLQVPDSIVRAAFQLKVGEISDLVVSELGVHLLQRTA